MTIGFALVAGSVIWTAYVYVLYPLLVVALAHFGRERPLVASPAPRVALLISAYNEEAVIETKIENALAQDFPEDEIMIFVSSDGSTDATNEIAAAFAARFGRVSLCAYPENRGKTAAIRDTLTLIADTADVVVFSDANAMYEESAIRHLVRHFSDESVGAVAGRLEYVNDGGEARYRRYENLIKRAEGRLGACAAAEGSIFAARASLIPALDPTHVEDLAIPLAIALGGHAVLFEPAARSWEEFNLGPRAQFRRRRRIVNRGVRSAWALRRELNPLRSGRVGWMFLSHRVARWLTPIALIVGTVGLGLVLIPRMNAPLWLGAACGVAAIALFVRTLPRGLRALADLPIAFVIANVAILVGILSTVTGAKAVRWVPERTP